MRFLSDSRLKETEEHSVVRIVSHIRVLSRFLGAEKKDFYEQVPIMVRELLYRLNDDDPSVLKAANGALAALSKHVPAEELVKHVEFIRNLLASMVSVGGHIWQVLEHPQGIHLAHRGITPLRKIELVVGHTVAIDIDHLLWMAVHHLASE